MTSLQLLAACKENLDRVNLPTTEETRIKDWINQSIREDICNLHSWPWMEDIYTQGGIAGTDFYEFLSKDWDLTSRKVDSGRRHKDVRWIRYRSNSTDEWTLLPEANDRAVNENIGEQDNGTPMVWKREYRDGQHGFSVRKAPDTTYNTDTGKGAQFQVAVWNYPNTFRFGPEDDELAVDSAYNSLVVKNWDLTGDRPRSGSLALLAESSDTNKLAKATIGSSATAQVAYPNIAVGDIVKLNNATQGVIVLCEVKVISGTPDGSDLTLAPVVNNTIPPLTQLRSVWHNKTFGAATTSDVILINKQIYEYNDLTINHSKLVEMLVTARGFLHYGQPENAAHMQNTVNIEIDKMLKTERSRDKQSNMTLRMSGAANRPSAGLRKGMRSNTPRPYAWINWTP